MATISLISLGSFCAISSATYAAPAFSSASSDQKQWVGKPAPSFKLQDQNAKWHELKQYQGKWIVLYFGGVLKSMLTLNEAIIDVKEG